jgi:uncharacterized protein YjbJ (UPF0337 family)
MEWSEAAFPIRANDFSAAIRRISEPLIPGMRGMMSVNSGTAVAAPKPAERGGSIMASGKSDKLKGRVKEAAGTLTGNKKLKRKGLVDQAIGGVRQIRGY